MKYFSTFLVLTILYAFPGYAQTDQSAGLAIIELFTSQSCADAPPADKIFEKTNQKNQKNLITLSCHTSYLNNDIWQDTLAVEACDQRQKAYLISKTINSFEIPQMIINGHAVISGTREDKIHMIANRMRHMQPVQKISLSINENILNVEMPRTENLSQKIDLWLFAYKNQETVDIYGGQNKGMKITYTNIVKDITHLDTWDGNVKSLSIPVPNQHTDGYVLIAETQGEMKMIAAGKISMPQTDPPEIKSPTSQTQP